MIIPAEIFKAYDIRGIYPTQLHEELATAIGRAFVVWLTAQPEFQGKPLTLVVGRDARTSGPALHAALVDGILAQGADIVDIGVVSSDQFYFACAHLGFPGVTVTASHNPKEYNGMKFVKKIPYFLSGKEGIQDLRAMVVAGNFPTSTRVGTLQHQDIRSAFVDKLLSVVDPSSIQPLVVVADTANAVGGPVLADVAARLPIQLTHLFAELDGTFPNHPADPLRPENRKAIEKAVRKQRAHVGFAFDGDADRCFIIDEKGKVVPNDFLGTLIACELLRTHPGSMYLYDVRSSWAFPRTVEAAGGKAFVQRVGHAYIKPEMLKRQAVYGVEVSGHHYFQDFYYCDSGMLPMLMVLEILSRHQQPLSQLVATYRKKYHITGEVNYTVKDPQGIMDRLKEKYSDAPERSTLDGISIDYKDWHFNVRSSNTEPLLRLNLESIKSARHMKEKLKEVESLIQQDK